MPNALSSWFSWLSPIPVLSFLLLPGGSAQSHALVFSDTELRIFQFPPDCIPLIDGKTDDWDIVPADYTYGTNLLLDVEDGRNMPVDPKDLDVKVRVGWVKGENRLYFLYEAYDNFWDFEGADLHNDMFEISVDGDLSGGEFIYLDYPNRIMMKGSHAQNYHILTPAAGKSPAMVWNCPAWLNRMPWFNCRCSYSFRQGESGRLVMECWITPFDYISSDGPEHSVVSTLRENGIIGLSWLIADWDGAEKRHALPSLSHDVRQVHDASFLRTFRLMPLVDRFQPKIFQAAYDFTIVNMEKRIVAFADRTKGDVAVRKWDFGDGTTSTERNPVHTYKEPGGYFVTLTVEGSEGKSRYSTLWEVLLK